MLTHAVALTVLPTGLVRVAVATILGLGAGVLAITVREQLRDTGQPGDSTLDGDDSLLA